MKKYLNVMIRNAYFNTTSTWYELDLSIPFPDIEADIDVKSSFEDRDALCSWIERQRDKFPWIYVEKEIHCAKSSDHPYLSIQCDDEIIGFIKIGKDFTYIGDFDKYIFFDHRTSFIYDTFVLPEYRGKNIALFAIVSAARYLKQMGFERILCHIELWNLPSIKTFSKAGFAPIGTIGFFRILGLPFFLRDGYLPFTDLESHLRRTGGPECLGLGNHHS